MRQLKSDQSAQLNPFAPKRAAAVCGGPAAGTAWEPEPLTGHYRSR